MSILLLWNLGGWSNRNMKIDGITLPDHGANRQ